MRKLLKISELVFDSELYPRLEVGWQTAYQYTQAMRAGSVFPPILVGSFEGKLYVVDGWHRIEAKKLLKEEYVEAKVKRYSDKQEMFVEAINLNSIHGRPLSTQEKVRLVWKLEQMEFDPKEISKIVKVPIDKIDVFRARVITGPNGKPVFLKSPVAKANAEDSDKLSVDMSLMNVSSVAHLLKQLIALLEGNVFPLEAGETKELTVRLYALLGERLELAVAS